MLTGPVTILNWSFPRADVSRELQSKQLALALRDEVIDLEKAGIHAVQVDEPAIREGLPLRRVDWDAYLKWAVDSFKLATAGVSDALQTHSHFCYSDFDDIFPSIQRLDADVISIEASKSDMKLLNTFKHYGYSNNIGPGVYDIHSPRVPGDQEIRDRVKAMLEILPDSLLFVNPVCHCFPGDCSVRLTPLSLGLRTQDSWLERDRGVSEKPRLRSTLGTSAVRVNDGLPTLQQHPIGGSARRR
jgi:5-methyltetrahydropteroyltriglutamate--homocysteine methyltransferase